MKFSMVLFVLLLSATTVLEANVKRSPRWYQHALKQSERQLAMAARTLYGLQGNPRTYEHGRIQLVNYTDWTSGFFPGSLWLMYELSGNKKFKEWGTHFTQQVYNAQFRTNTHDLGFILYCSYGHAFRITQDETILPIFRTGAKSLMTRYNSRIGMIKSWDKIVGPWEFPVIIDNMMNLEFLYEVGRMNNNSTWMEAAISHADKTLAHHFRPDHSSYHVVDFDSITGKVISKETHQGFKHESSWSRGQAWGLYGFTMMYRLTGKTAYKQQAEKIASFILSHPRLPADLIPYWDMDAPGIPHEPRDASAAAIIASALFELSTFKDAKPQYFQVAEQILKNLSAKPYLAQPGTNGFFILKHSTGNWPKNSEIDTPLSYADYYYLEALKRYGLIKNYLSL